MCQLETVGTTVKLYAKQETEIGRVRATNVNTYIKVESTKVSLHFALSTVNSTEHASESRLVKGKFLSF